MVNGLRLTLGLRRTAFALLLPAFHAHLSTAGTFEGRITATLTRAGVTQTFVYSVGTNQLRIERGETDRPYPKDIVNLGTGEVTLLFPHNRSFLRLTTPNSAGPASLPAAPGMPMPTGGLPSGINSQSPGGLSPASASLSAPVGPTNLVGAPGLSINSLTPSSSHVPPGIGPPASSGGPAMPMFPPMQMEQAEFETTTDTTNLFGYACTRYELKQHGEIMEIWATDKLPAFEPYLRSQPLKFGPPMLEERWGEILKSRKLFPLLAILSFGMPSVLDGASTVPSGPERVRFEVKSVTEEKIDDRNGELFQPPPDYQEIQPLPF